MANQASATLLILAQALKGLDTSKTHLKKAAREFLLAAQSITSTASAIALDAHWVDPQSPFREAFKKGENLLNEVIRNISTPEDEEIVSAPHETSKVSRLPTKRKHLHSKRGPERG